MAFSCQQVGLACLVLATELRNQVDTLSSSINVYADEASLPGWIDNRQDRAMSMQAERSSVEFIPAAELRVVIEACSTPLVGEPVTESAAAGLDRKSTRLNSSH